MAFIRIIPLQAAVGARSRSPPTLTNGLLARIPRLLYPPKRNDRRCFPTDRATGMLADDPRPHRGSRDPARRGGGPHPSLPVAARNRHAGRPFRFAQALLPSAGKHV